MAMLCMLVIAACKDDKKDEPTVPEPTPTPTSVAVTGVSTNKSTVTLMEGGSETVTAKCRGRIAGDGAAQGTTQTKHGSEVITQTEGAIRGEMAEMTDLPLVGSSVVDTTLYAEIPTRVEGILRLGRDSERENRTDNNEKLFHYAIGFKRFPIHKNIKIS